MTAIGQRQKESTARVDRRRLRGSDRRRGRPLLACVLAWLVAHALMALVGTAPALAQATGQAGSGSTETKSDAQDFDFDAYESPEEDDADARDDRRTAAEEEEDRFEGSAFKGSDIETLVVTGTQSDSASDLSSGDSVTSFGSDDLDAIGAQDVSDLAAYTPNLEIVTGGATTPTFFIRGVGLNDFNSNSTGAVAIYQDDVPINAPAMQLPSLFDIEAVNVLRGPQGTGPNRNASAGAIKIYSRKPTGGFGGFLRAEGGNYDYMDFEGAVEAPVFRDMLSGRVAFRFTARDGTMTNRCANAPPQEDRVEVPGGAVLSQLGLTNTDAPWSICGEPVVRFAPPNFDNKSDVPTGLASRVNDIGNWAIRGTLLFQPTLEQEWLFGMQASKRDEYARLGQSIGTKGFYCVDGDVDNCGYPGQSSDSSRIEGLLGGRQASTGYQAPEIRARLIELAPCNQPIPGRPSGTCFLSAAQGGDRALDNASKIQLANELAAGLDSEPWAGDFNRTGKVTNDTIGGFLNGTIELANGDMILTSVTGYNHYDRNNDIDLDFSPQTLFHIFTDDRGWEVTQEVSLHGQLGRDAQVQWDVGTYFLTEELNVGVYNDLGVNQTFGVNSRDYTQNLYSLAGYASASWDFWDDFTLDGGFRYNWERKVLDYRLFTSISSGDPLTQNLSNDWSAPTGTVRLTYRFRADTSVFAKYTRGWKPGTYNATSSAGTGVSVARPETIDAYETGVSGSWLDDRFGLNGSFFYYSYKDYQLFTAQQFADGQPEFVILNADASEVYGAEVEAVVTPWLGGLVNVRFGWLQSQFLDFVQLQQERISVNGQQVVVDRELQNTGNQVLNAPRFKVSLSGQQTVDFGKWGAVTARYDGVWTDTTYYDATEGRGIPNVDNVAFLPPNTIAQQAYWLHNMRLSFMTASQRIEVALWVRNLTNQAYKTFGFDGSTFNNTTIYFVGDPRTFGGTATFNF